MLLVEGDGFALGNVAAGAGAGVEAPFVVVPPPTPVVFGLTPPIEPVVVTALLPVLVGDATLRLSGPTSAPPVSDVPVGAPVAPAPALSPFGIVAPVVVVVLVLFGVWFSSSTGAVEPPIPAGLLAPEPEMSVGPFALLLPPDTPVLDVAGALDPAV